MRRSFLSPLLGPKTSCSRHLLGMPSIFNKGFPMYSASEGTYHEEDLI